MPGQQPDAAVDTDRLAQWLHEQVQPLDGPLTLTPLSGGQSNPTYRLNAGSQAWVLRRKPPGVLLASAHAVEREYRVMRALIATGVPVPEMLALCEDPTVIGSPFYLMRYVQGRVFGDPSLPGLSNAERGAVYDEMNRIMAAIHTVDPAAVGLADYGRPERFLARQVDRWTRQYRASETERIDEMERLIDWLPAHLPSVDDPALVHGDFRIDNLIFHPERPQALAVIDWELSTLGHGLGDFAYHAMSWRLTPDEFRGLVGHPLTALGIPSEPEHLARYCGRRGLAMPPAAWDVLIAFNMFRMAAILQGILARARQGNATAADAEATGQRARLLARAGWRQALRAGAA